MTYGQIVLVGICASVVLYLIVEHILWKRTRSDAAGVRVDAVTEALRLALDALETSVPSSYRRTPEVMAAHSKAISAVRAALGVPGTHETKGNDRG
jgi:hypothetical protein